MSTKVWFSITIAIVLALAACGDGGPPDAAELYGNAGEKMAALTSYHATGEGQEEEGTFRVELDFVLADKVEGTITFTEDEESFELRFIAIGDQLYVSPLESPDYFIAPEEEFAEFGGIADFLTALTAEISDLTYLNEETIDGVATHHLQGVLTPDVLEIVDPEEAPTEDVPVELWIGKDDSLIYRYHWVEPDETITLSLSRFDEAISVEAPANPRPAAELEQVLQDLFGIQFETPEDVKEAIESLSVEEQDCLRRVLGDAAFEELAAGTRLPTEEEFQKGEECFP